ncbi:hypothetical protein KAW18_00575 [candidate division WOR-3 bacterium]|nr:hypothetical protein [candidate division WOR-3 bacterium]
MNNEINRKAKPEPVYLPSNEPYLGRESVFYFDQVIISCLEANADIAAYTHQVELSELQKAACQIIPQGINLALTIRELVRQGYLFGASVLMRPLIERAAIISYLHVHPDEVEVWQKGWQFRERPSLAKMLETMSGNADITVAKQICETFGHIVHGDPIGSQWNLVHLSDGGLGYSVGKVINDPDLCDFICFQSYCYLIVLMGMMAACFPNVAISNVDIEKNGGHST